MFARKAHLIAACILFGLTTSRPVSAVDKNWIDPAGGTFTDPNNWSPTGAPGAADRAVFSLGGNYTVHFLLFFNETNSRLRIGNDAVTLSLAGRTYTLTNTNSISIGGSLFPPRQVGQFTVSGGTVSGASADIGDGRFGSGTLNVASGATLNLSALLNVASAGVGYLNVTGGDVTCLLGTIGYNATGHAIISGGSSTLTCTSHLDVGGNANGDLTIQAGGHAQNASASIGPVPGVTGTVVVTDLGSRWDFTGALKVGEFGTGTLSVASAALVYNNTFTADSIIGDQNGSSGTVTVDAATWTNNHGLEVGNIGTGALTIQNGGYVNASPGYIGYSPGGHGTVHVTGTGSNWSPSNLFVGGSAIAAGGTAVLNIDGGGAVSTSGNTVKFYGPGTVNLGAGGILTSGTLTPAGGTFNWTGGTLRLTNMDLPISGSGPLGSAVTVGAGMLLDVYPSVQVATGGNGALTLSSGGQVRTYGSYVGDAAGMTGTVVVDGSGSLWTSLNPFVVGQGGHATLLIQNAGMVQSNADAVGNPAGIVGNYGDSLGEVVIDGAGSQWNLGPLTGPTYLDVGEYGTGTLTIRNGGNVTNNYGGGTIGTYSGSVGTATVTDPNSTWLLDAYGLVVGWYGTGALHILNRGVVLGGQFAADTSIAQQAGAHGTATVDGAGSLLSAGILNVGEAGTGTLGITGGGSVTAAEAYLGAFPGANGTVTVDGPGSSLIVSGAIGTLGVGSAATGTLAVSNGGRVQAKEAFIGDGTTATGTALVSGAGSTFDCSEELHVGYLGTGSLTVDAGGAVHATNSLDVGVAGTLTGDGNVAAAVVSNAGRVAPGSPVGVLTISGAYTQGPAGVLALDLGGATPGAGYDQLAVSGPATVDGALHVSLAGGFHPGLGQTFTVLTAGSVSGAFASVATTSSSLGVSVFYNAQSVVVQITHTPPYTGDLNCDGVVNFADINPFIVALSGQVGYEAAFPHCNWLNGDTNGDGVVNFADINPFIALLSGT